MLDDLAQLEEIFGEALARADAAARTAYLNGACAGDAHLRGRVEALLVAHAVGGELLKLPEEGVVADATAPIGEALGTKIDQYKLLEQIGEGGFGVVFMAEQEEPIRRRVALKIIKPGMDTRQVVARFEAERQALAMMDHPNIAKVFDAGVTGPASECPGRPYFVMDLIRGMPITKYCDAEKLGIPERLELFIQICQAVQHAHQKGIIHRDLKPSNVLVTHHDDTPTPKIIDFGVAKAIEGKLTDRTLYTGFHQLVGTPTYMSPEQAQLSGIDIDTRSDIYSLGVLLYELLTGTTPFDADQLLGSSFAEMQRLVRDVEPPSPSTRITKLAADTRTVRAKERRADPQRLAQILRGELDWIVMRCLEKDRRRRYQTANDLAADVRRHLNDEPVQACPPSATYRFRKMARRHKVALASATIVAASLALGATISVWQATVARRAERLAESRFVSEQAARRRASAEAAKAIAISDVLQQMLQAANPDAARGAEYSVRQMLDDFSAEFFARLEDEPEVKATIHSIIGNAYQRLGEHDKASPHLESALNLRKKAFGNRHAEVAKSLVELARFKSEQGRSDEAIALAKEALSIDDTFETPDEQRIKVLDELALQLWAVGKWDQLTPIVDEMRAIAAKNPDKYPEQANLLHRLAETMEDPVVGEEYAREAVGLHQRLHGKNHPETAWGVQALAKTLRRQAKFAEAAQFYEQALAIFRLHYDNSDAPVVLTLANIASVRRFQGDKVGLQELREEAGALAHLNSSDFERWRYAGELHAQLDQWEDAESSFTRMRELAPAFSFYGSKRIAWIRLARSDNRAFVQACKELVRLAQSVEDPEHWREAAWVSSITPNSGVPSSECEDLAARAAQANPKDVASLTTHGAALYRAGLFEKARRQLSTAIELAKDESTYAYFLLAMTEHHLGRPAEARASLGRGVALMDDYSPAGKLHVLSEWIEHLAMQSLRHEAEQVLAEGR